MKFRTTVNSASLEATQELVLETGSVVQIEIKGPDPSDIEAAVLLLEQEYGEPVGKVNIPKSSDFICFWRKPFFSWKTEFHELLPTEKMDAILSQYELSPLETAMLSGVLLVLQIHKCSPKSASYITYQLADAPPDRQDVLLTAAFEIKNLVSTTK